jgi:LPS-assembly protein
MQDRGWTKPHMDIKDAGIDMKNPVPFRFIKCAVCAPLVLCASLGLEAAQAQQSETPQETKRDDIDNIDFSADTIDYDSVADIVTANGNVIVSRDGYKLRADTVVWSRKTGQVTANGNIRSIGPRGDVAYGDGIELTDTLKDGVVDNLLLVLKDGSRLAANKGARTDGRLTLEQAAYTPCKVEQPDGCPKEPSWQVKAARVVYDPEKKRVSYKNARIELFGLPIIPLPGLSHPAETQAGDGFLVPNLRFSRNNGVEIEQGYYWRLSQNRDLTVSGHLFTKVAPMAHAQFRGIEDRGAFQMTAYATYSNRLSTAAGATNGTNAFRGYFDGTGRFQLTPEWSASTSIRLASDRTFLRRYDISRDDRLRSTFAVERIDADSYLSFAGWAVQTLRTGDRQGLAPVALPEVDYRLRLADPVLGGKVQLQANTLLLGRTSGQDTQRAFGLARWDRRSITGLGQELTLTALARGDVYNSDENASTLTAIYRGDSGWKARGTVTAAADLRWPLVGKAFGDATQILTPRLQLIGTKTTSNLEVPNEDSRAVDLEDSNLFALNRFSGYDRIENNFRVTYGLDWSVRGQNMTFDFNVGQSYRLSNQAGIFPNGTGLSDKVSDIVGRSEFRFKDFVKLTHRFRLDKDSFAIRRNEIDATVGSRSTYVQVGYLKLNRDINTVEDLSDREEIRLAGRVRVVRYWSIFGSTIIDLTSAKEDPLSFADGFDPIRHRLGIAYDDDCLSLSVTWRRDYQPTGDARRGNTFLFRLAFRNLGV